MSSTSEISIEDNKYATAKQERQKHVDKVLSSKSEKKIVVAGPGTGKTYLFRKVLEDKKESLTLTFVNALVEDLSLELCGISDVKTLHSFALNILKKARQKDIKIFPKLSKVIEEDARILLNKNIDYDYLFYNRDDNNKDIEFYKKRKDYYQHYGFSDIVFAAVKYFEEKKDLIPKYTQVVVDEFQDFNTLEVSLIELLAEKSPILLAGDDDQALYESLKSASPSHIRQRHNSQNYGYTPFCLPYCSRCTHVIVDAINDIITNAKQCGYLSSRIHKPFQYFPDVEKDSVSINNSKLMYGQFQSRQIPWYIQHHIGNISQEVRDKFSVLVLSQTKPQCQTIGDSLKGYGFKNVHLMKKQGSEEPTLLDGLKLLIDAKREFDRCNLGWRIVAKNIFNDAEFVQILQETHRDQSPLFSDLIKKAKKKSEVTQMLSVIRAVRDGKKIKDEKFVNLFNKLGIDPYLMAKEWLKDEIKPIETVISNPGIRKIPITVTTIQSSKGLSADYVFITHFDDLFFIKNQDKSIISDQDICNFLVALTRARKKVFLFSSIPNKTPTFMKWIDKNRIEDIRDG